jgi:hypothetical protein
LFAKTFNKVPRMDLCQDHFFAPVTGLLYAATYLQIRVRQNLSGGWHVAFSTTTTPIAISTLPDAIHGNAVMAYMDATITTVIERMFKHLIAVSIFPHPSFIQAKPHSSFKYCHNPE